MRTRARTPRKYEADQLYNPCGLSRLSSDTKAIRFSRSSGPAHGRQTLAVGVVNIVTSDRAQSEITITKHSSAGVDATLRLYAASFAFSLFRTITCELGFLHPLRDE